MIMRIFLVTARPGKEADFARFFHQTAIPQMKLTDGGVEVLPGALHRNSPRNVASVMIWRNIAALRASAGEHCDSPHTAPDQAELVANQRISHCELVVA